MDFKELSKNFKPDELEPLAESVGLLVGYFTLRRKLKKLGFSKREQFVLLSVFSSLSAIRVQVMGIRKALR